MELFKTDVLKKEYEEFNKTLVPAVLECGFCNIVSCKYHSKFIFSCNLCRNVVCKTVKNLTFQNKYY